MKGKKTQKQLQKKLTSGALILSLAVSGTAVSGIPIPNNIATVRAVTVTGQEFETNGFKFKVIKNNLAVQLLGLSDSSTETNIVIPANVTVPGDNFQYSFPVTEIAEEAFKENTSIQSVTMGANVKTIAGSAFLDCEQLTSISLNEGLTTLGSNCFSGTNISSIILPGSLTTVDHNHSDSSSPFYNCSALKNITFAEGTTTIANHLFAGFSTLTNITILETVTKIGAYAFAGCPALTSIKLPSKLEVIGEEAFLNDTALTEIVLPDTLKEIGPRAFSACSKLQEVTIPNSLTTVTNDSSDNKSPFYKCENLKKVTFLEGRTSIPNFILEGASSVTDIVIPSSVTSIEKDALKDYSSDLKITGYTNSYAEKFATEENIPFVSIGIADVVPSTAPTATANPSTAPTAEPTTAPTTTPVKKPEKVTITKVTRNSSKNATIKFKAVKNAVKYQVVYSTSNKFTKSSKKTTTATTVKLTNLKKGKAYYVKVCAYAKNENGKLIPGSYSSVKKIAKK